MLSRDLTEQLEVCCVLLPRLAHDLRSGAVDVTELVQWRDAITTMQTQWMRAALACRASWPRWNALLRVWLLWTIMGALSIKRTRLQAAPKLPMSAWWYQPPTAVVELVESCRRSLSVPAESPCRTDEVFARLRSDRIVPPLFDFGQPDARSYRLTRIRRIRMLLWATVFGRKELAHLMTGDNVTGIARTNATTS